MIFLQTCLMEQCQLWGIFLTIRLKYSQGYTTWEWAHHVPVTASASRWRRQVIKLPLWLVVTDVLTFQQISTAAVQRFRLIACMYWCTVFVDFENTIAASLWTFVQEAANHACNISSSGQQLMKIQTKSQKSDFLVGSEGFSFLP